MGYFEIPLLISSSETEGAILKNSQGSDFSIDLGGDSLQIPNNARKCKLTVLESSLWYVSYNISASRNNNIFLYNYSSTDYTLIIPDGLYDLPSLSQAISNGIQAQTTGNPIDLVTLQADYATSKVYMEFGGTVNVTFDTAQNTINSVIGFNDQVINGLANEIVQGENVANFNIIEYFLIKSDLVDRGLRLNNTYSQIIEKVSINVQPGSLIVQKDNNPIALNCQNLIGQSVNRIRFWLTDQSGILVDTVNEDWTLRLLISYET